MGSLAKFWVAALLVVLDCSLCVAAAEGGLVSQLIIATGPNDQWPFAGEVSPSGEGSVAKETLFRNGAATGRFDCSSPGSPLAVEQDNVGVRRLRLVRGEPPGLLQGLGFGGDADKKQLGLFVTDAKLEVEEGVGTVDVALEQPLPNGTWMEVTAGSDEHQTRSTLVVQYECIQDGEALIKLRLQATADDGSSAFPCLRWTKVCRRGWQHLEIRQGTLPVFLDGAVQELWRSRMQAEGTQRPVTRFDVSAGGRERVRPPVAYSNQKLLKVEVVGPFVFGDATALEIGSDPVQFTVMYTCEYDGFADVTLAFTKDTLSPTRTPEPPLELSWRKHCGVAEYRNLEVNVRSDAFRNSTQAVRDGAALPGFGRPCPSRASSAADAKAKSGAGVPTPVGGCDQQGPTFVVPATDSRTSLELRLADDDGSPPPMFAPPADLSYDNRLMRAVVTQSMHGTPLSSRKVSKSRNQAMLVKYTCFKEGSSTVTLTLHMVAYKPVYVSWLKRCNEPKVRVGRALTAPQALVITLFVCGVIGMVACVVFISSGKSDVETYRHEWSPGDDWSPAGGRTKGRAGDLELEAARSWASPDVLGRGRSGEVTLH